MTSQSHSILALRTIHEWAAIKAAAEEREGITLVDITAVFGPGEWSEPIPVEEFTQERADEVAMSLFGDYLNLRFSVQAEHVAEAEHTLVAFLDECSAQFKQEKERAR